MSLKEVILKTTLGNSSFLIGDSFSFPLQGGLQGGGGGVIHVYFCIKPTFGEGHLFEKKKEKLHCEYMV